MMPTVIALPVAAVFFAFIILLVWPPRWLPGWLNRQITLPADLADCDLCAAEAGPGPCRQCGRSREVQVP